MLLAGVILFVSLNGVSKGVLTLMEAVATPLFTSIYSGPQPVIATAQWYAVLGAGGLLSGRQGRGLPRAAPHLQLGLLHPLPQVQPRLYLARGAGGGGRADRG